MMSPPFVPLTMTVSACGVAGGAADRAGEIDVDLCDVGPAQVVDGDGVDAAQRIDVDALDVVEVHDDVAEIAGEADASAVGRDLEDFSPAAAVEEQRVGAVLALDDVAAVAGIPLEDVVAGAEEGGVVALLAVDEIVAVAAEEDVDAVAAENGVVAGAAVDRQFDEGSQIAGGAEAVVAAVHVEDEIFGGPDVEAERRGIEPVEAHPRAVGGGGEEPRRRCRR